MLNLLLVPLLDQRLSAGLPNQVEVKVEVENEVEIRAKTQAPMQRTTQAGIRSDEHREILRETRHEDE